MAVPNFSGGLDKYILLPQAALSRTAPVAPQTGYLMPVTTFDISPRQSFEAFDTLNITGNPSKQLESTEPVNGTFDWYLTYDTFPLIAAHAIGGTVTTGAGPDYVHVNTLGDQVNKIAEALALEHHQLQADPASYYILTYGGRVSIFSLTATVNSGVVFSTTIEALKQAAPSTTVVCDTITGFTDDPVSSIIMTLDIDTVATECLVTEFTMELNHDIDTDQYPLGSGGSRCTLTRGNPTVTGTFNVFFNDSTYAYITAALARPKTAFDFVLNYDESASRYMHLSINNAILAIQGMPVNGSGGYMCNFSYTAFGSAAVVAETGNQTASYPV